MPRIISIPLDRPLAAYVTWAAAAILPLALLACSDAGDPATRTDTAGASPTVVEVGEPVTGSPESVATAADAIIEVSYADAEQVFSRGEYGDAAELFSAYAERRPDNVWGHYMLGLSAYRSGDLIRAEQAFDRALEIDPTHVKSYVNSARVLLDLGRSHEAVERANLALVHDGTSSDALRLLARAHAALGQTDEAIRTYQQALVVDDRDVWAMNNLGLLYIELGRPEDALPPLARAVQLRSTAPVFQNNLGVALERTGHLAQAAEAYTAALQADSTYGKAGISLERVRTLIDASVVNDVDLAELAETFRLRIRMWSDTAARQTDAEAEQPDTAVTQPDAMVEQPDAVGQLDSVVEQPDSMTPSEPVSQPIPEVAPVPAPE
jgi:tetratricopeptide (TPR) repeat protein